MSGTDGLGAEAAVTNGQLPEPPADEDSASALAADATEPATGSWFTPASNGTDSGASYDGSQTDWFLRTGRAGLLPDSITESWDDNGAGGVRAATAGAPPWAGDVPAPGQDAPPPWESGPWPGPGEARPVTARPATARLATARPAARLAQSPAAADTGNWQSTAAFVSVPLVVPGLVLGVVGLRRARVTGTGRTASWLAIAFSAIWAIVLGVWIASAGSTAGDACGSYQTGVSYAVSQVLHDLASGAPPSVVSADLDQAISQANAAAAGAQQVPGRNAMATLTASLEQAAAQAAGSASDAAVHQQVAVAEAAMVSACKA